MTDDSPFSGLKATPDNLKLLGKVFDQMCHRARSIDPIYEGRQKFNGRPRRFSDAQIQEIRTALARGQTAASLAREYHTTDVTIGAIKHRKLYGDIE